MLDLDSVLHKKKLDLDLHDIMVYEFWKGGGGGLRENERDDVMEREVGENGRKKERGNEGEGRKKGGGGRLRGFREGEME